MADSSSLQSLLSTKAALDLGLITQSDFDAVKGAFLRAQQIKAAQDVGLIKPEDYEETKQSYLASLLAAGVAPVVSAPSAAPVAPPAAAPAPPPAEPAAPRPAPVSWQIPPPAPKPAATVAPPPAAPQQQQQQQPPAVAAAAAPAPALRHSRQPSASNPDVPSNIPKMGGIKALNQGTSMSGIAVTEDAVNLFYLMRLKATYKWALWQVDDGGTAVIIAAVGERQSTWQDFLAALPDNDCRYGVFDFDFQTPDGQKLHKMIFLNWAPDTARVKAKMMYASTKDFFKSHLDGLSLEFQASDRDDISEQEVGDAVRAMKRG